MNSVVFVLFFISYLNVEVLGQMCQEAGTCQSCYSIPGCAWCTANDINQRCFSPSDSTVMCPESNTQDEDSEVILDELELTEDNQISLRKATVRLRAGDSESFQFNVRAAENFPFDLYMLVDLSFSLLDDLNTIKSISTDIADAIRNISTRFQVGFGTFVDKLDLPYIQTRTLSLPFMHGGQPTACEGDVCVAPFSYVHNGNLTNNSTRFSLELNDLTISTNADNPEGTFDAMHQAILCKDIVGWRENSRKIILVITDDTIHMAGDGIFAGIVRPVPDECFTQYDPETKRFTYVDNTDYDYPSVEQLTQLFEENLVSPVFAVLGNIRPLYDELSSVMSSTGAQTVTLEAGSVNLIEALQTAYENIVSEVRLSYNVGADELIVTNSVSCPSGTNSSADGLSCSGVSVNQTITFTVNVTLLECTEDFVNGPRVINVNIPGYGRFQIQVEGICTCACQDEGQPASPMCSGNGTLACGVCECDEGWSGDACNCRTEDIDSLICVNGANGVQCSGFGDCVCGECQCDVQGNYVMDTSFTPPRYNLTSTLISGGGLAVLIEPPRVYGEACQCTNYLCNRNSNNLVCSGSQGNCSCSECECLPFGYGIFDYSGTACECSKAFCFDRSIPYTDDAEPCNGNGECDECNPVSPCNCQPGFVPPYCEPSALGFRQCLAGDARVCVECIADQEDYMEQCNTCFNDPSIMYSKIFSDPPENLQGSQVNTTEECSFTNADTLCSYRYFLAIGNQSTSGNEVQIVHILPSDCFPLQWWHLALILLGSLIVLGIIILVIIKIIFMILDYKEVKHLDKSVAETDLSKNFNPLYQSPEVKYDNIAFGKE